MLDLEFMRLQGASFKVWLRAGATVLLANGLFIGPLAERAHAGEEPNTDAPDAPDAAPSPIPSTPPPAASAPATASATPSPVAPVPEQPAPGPSVSVELGVGVMGEVGFHQDRVGVALAPSIVILLPPNRSWGIFLGGGISLNSNDELKKDIDTQTSFKHGALGLCLTDRDREAVRAMLCGGVLAGQLQVRARFLEFTRPQEQLVAGPFMGGRLSFGPRPATSAPRRTFVFGYLGLNVVVPLARADITYRQKFSRDSTGAFRASAVAVTAELGFGVGFP